MAKNLRPNPEIGPKQVKKAKKLFKKLGPVRALSPSHQKWAQTGPKFGRENQEWGKVGDWAHCGVILPGPTHY